jgi:hypothetical protein
LQNQRNCVRPTVKTQDVVLSECFWSAWISPSYGLASVEIFLLLFSSVSSPHAPMHRSASFGDTGTELSRERSYPLPRKITVQVR